ncbi:MAG: ribonucleoside triphosphate reductase, partial [Oscillospiraceae bacterium]|nr:ribonucleoside triphosphate reductase [Oscillospiraceae bacterium]
AKHDVERYPDIITASEAGGTPYYTNSSHLPVGYTEDIFTALDIQDELQTLYTSGTVFHAFLGEKMPDWRSAAALVRKIAENYKLPYYTLSPTYSICKNDGYLTGEQYVCPHCGEKAEVYSRITGYYRPVQNWNDGKTQEFKQRKVYDISTSTLKKTAVKTAPTAEAAVSAASGDDVKLTLFARVTCPNCRAAEAQLNKAGITYEKLIAEDNLDLAAKYGIKGAPTLVVEGEAGFDKYYGVPEIKKYITGASAALA